MLTCQLDIQFEEGFEGLVSEISLRRAVEQTLLAVGVTSPLEMGLVIAGDDTIRALNKEYRGVDDTTDVLAFALGEQAVEEAEAFVLPPDDIRRLGEVIISYIQALRQAEEQGHSVERELALLVVHGVLHLLGYDHEHPEAEQRMRTMEAKVLATIKDKE